MWLHVCRPLLCGWPPRCREQVPCCHACTCRFLCAKPVACGRFQLLGLACLWVASKYEEVRFGGGGGLLGGRGGRSSGAKRAGTEVAKGLHHTPVLPAFWARGTPPAAPARLCVWAGVAMAGYWCCPLAGRSMHTAFRDCPCPSRAHAPAPGWLQVCAPSARQMLAMAEHMYTGEDIRAMEKEVRGEGGHRAVPRPTWRGLRCWEGWGSSGTHARGLVRPSAHPAPHAQRPATGVLPPTHTQRSTVAPTHPA
jgi:hypothetical protein